MYHIHNYIDNETDTKLILTQMRVRLILNSQ